MVMRSRVQVETCVGEFSVAFTAQASHRCPTDVNVKKTPSLITMMPNYPQERSSYPIRRESPTSPTVQLRTNGNSEVAMTFHARLTGFSYHYVTNNFVIFAGRLVFVEQRNLGWSFSLDLN